LVRVVLRATARAATEEGAEGRVSATGAASAGPDDPRARRLLLSGYVLGAVGLASLAAGGAVGIVGHGELKDLREEDCRPGCSKREVAAGRRKYVAANVAFGVGGALLATAVVTWALGYRKQRERRSVPTLAADGHGVSVGWGGQF